MPRFTRPTVVISRCIDFDACRYNGQIIRASLREELQPHVDLRPICPELEIGLGVPRDPVRLVEERGEVHMEQPSSGRDLTGAMSSFSDRYLASVGEVDGFILKSRSPSCAARDAKVYPEGGGGPPRSGPGLFAAGVARNFPRAAIEDEGRLDDLRIRDHFLTRIFTAAAFRDAAARRSTNALVEFHARNKLLLMAHSESRMRRMGRAVAGREQGVGPATAAYRDDLAVALARPARTPAHVNVLMHVLGHFSERLSRPEKAHFLDMLDAFRARRLPLQALTSLLRSWAERFEVAHLEGQSYLQPYPDELVQR
jgi:uncharacterized protein YbgA (DUF1722 family)/uncharacterized protein YbbK (DUF523 family)